MAEWVIGIDPGATGALALYSVTDATVMAVQDMPHIELTLTTGKKSKRVDIQRLREILEQWKFLTLEKDAQLYVHIEQVQAFSKQSAPAAFNFGYAAAIPFAVCTMLDMDIKFIHPNTWKNQFGLKASAKDESRLLALKLFPYLSNILKRKLDVDRADAILLATYKPRIA